MNPLSSLTARGLSCLSRPDALPVTIALGALWLLLLPTNTFLQGLDFVLMHVFYKSYLQYLLFAGELPWWNPYTALGRPFFADIETAVLYPPNWVVLPLGPTWGSVALVGFQLWLGAAGMLKLARHWGLSNEAALFGAITFTFAGFSIGRLQAGQLQVFCTLSWWPWLCYSAALLHGPRLKRAIARLAACLALAYLAGSPPLFWVGSIGLAVFVVGQSLGIRDSIKQSGWLGVAALLSLGVVAVQLFSFAELVGQGNRPLDSISFATRNGEWGYSWLSLVLPVSSGFCSNWEYNQYVGAVTFFLALTALATQWRGSKTIPALVASALITGILSLGDHTSILPFLAEHAPGFAALRCPSRYAAFTAFALILLSMWGLNAWRPAWPVRTALWTLHVSALVFAVYSQTRVYTAALPTSNEPMLLKEMRAGGLLVVGQPPPRVALPLIVARPNSGMINGYSTVSSFANPALARVWNYIHLVAERIPDPYNRIQLDEYVQIEAALRDKSMSLVANYDLAAGRPYFTTANAPRAYLARCFQPIPDWHAAALAMRAGHDIQLQPLLETNQALPPGPPEKSIGTVTFTHFSPNRIHLHSFSPHAGLLILGEAWYPGWRATVDGRPTPVLPANAWMRAIALPAGTHEIIFSYRPRWLYQGLVTSLLSGLVILVLWRQPAPQPVDPTT